MSRPDEGMIHAWLDGELDAAEAARIEALVRDDAEWAAAAAEARGFIAASARIVGALDHVPANVIPKVATTAPKAVSIDSARDVKRAATRGTPWWAMRAAALLVIAAGTAMVIRRAPNESSGVNALVQATVKSTTDSAATPATARSADSAATSQPSTASASDATKEKGVVGQARNAPARPTLVDANEADAQLRRRTGDAQPQQRARPAPNRGIQSIAAAPRDRLDERRTALADSVGPARARSAEVAATASSVASGAGASASASAGAGAGASGSISKLQAELKSSDLKKDAVPTAKAITAVAVTGPVNAISIEACFREPAGPGTASILHRVGRIDDSTALAGAAIGMRAEESGFRARQFPAVAPIPAPAPALSAPLARMKIRGDTLFVSAAGTLARIALKTSCPPK